MAARWSSMRAIGGTRWSGPPDGTVDSLLEAIETGGGLPASRNGARTRFALAGVMGMMTRGRPWEREESLPQDPGRPPSAGDDD